GVVLNTRNGEGAGRRRETCGDLGLTSDEIPGQGNIDVAGLTFLSEFASSRGPYDKAFPPSHRGWWITTGLLRVKVRMLSSFSDPYERALYFAIGKRLVEQQDGSDQQNAIES